jgi:hypothetical protein
MKGGKRPRDALHGQPLMDMGVFQDIVVIVITEEIVVANAAKGDESNYCKDDADSDYLPRPIDLGIYDGLSGWRLFELGFALARFFGHGGDLRLSGF